MSSPAAPTMPSPAASTSDDQKHFSIAITGAGGYIGTRLVDRALRDGHKVHALGRRPLGRPRVADVAFDLRHPDRVSLPERIDVLVHLAVDTSGAAMSHSRQVAAAEALAAALPSPAKLIFVSSQSARADAPSDYGRTKWVIESLVHQWGGVSVRPGLVYGGPERGLFGRLCAAVRKLPVLPAFVGPRPITQPIHVDDLAEGILRLVKTEWSGGSVIALAQPEPIPFDDFLRAIAARGLGVSRFFLPVPIAWAEGALGLAGRFLKRDVGASQLASLSQTRAMDTAADLARLGLTLRPLETGLGRRPTSARRALLNEATRLLAYILGEPPGLSLVRRYTRIMEARGSSALIVCSGSVHRSGMALAILDRRGGGGHAWDRMLVERLDLALRVAEASPRSFDRFIGTADGRTLPFTAVVLIGIAIVREVVVRLTRFAAITLARRILGMGAGVQ